MFEIQTNAAILNSFETHKTEKMKNDENKALLLQAAAKLATEDSSPLMKCMDVKNLHITKCTNELCLRSCLMKIFDASEMRNHPTLLMVFYNNRDE